MSTIPYHVAVILDGNRRWAKEKGLPTFEGHRRGFKAAKKIAEKARNLGIKVLTYFAFSTENWDRSPAEINYLMKLYERMIDENLKEAIKNKVRLIHIGRTDRIPRILAEKIKNALEQTKKFTKHYLVIALDYGGRDEILRIIKKLKISSESVENFREDDIYRYLDTKDLPYPNVDLLIRTSGEMRVSGFLIWQAAYAEYIFVKQYLPDFTPQLFEDCIKEFGSRQRRFGK